MQGELAMRNAPPYLVESEETLRVHFPGSLSAIQETLKSIVTYLQLAGYEHLEKEERMANYQNAVVLLQYVQDNSLWMANKADQIIQQINNELS